MRSLPLFVPVLLLLLSPCAAGEGPFYPPTEYSAQSIHGRVVDATTGQPLEGVIIVAQWILYDINVGGGNARRRLQVLETVTAADGTYAFPAWGPKPNLWNLDLAKAYFCCVLTDRDPLLDFFKPGYRPRVLLNEKPIDMQSSVRTSDWDGKTIELEPFKGAVPEWERAISFLQSDLGWLKMDWRACPRMVLAIEEERVRYRLSHLRVSDLESLGTTKEEILRELGRRP
jgi:hypothetical protein